MSRYSVEAQRFALQRTGLKQRLLKEIDDRLTNWLGTLKPGFVRALAESNAVISGSFIVQALLGDHWRGSDVDVFVPVRGVKRGPGNAAPIDEFLEQRAAKLNRPLCAVSGYYRSMGAAINKVSDYLVDQTKVQIIHVDVEPDFDHMCEYICRHFDLTCCMHAYAPHEDGTGRLWSADLQGTLARTSEVQFNNRLGSTMMRHFKYSARGFDIRFKPAELRQALEADPKFAVFRVQELDSGVIDGHKFSIREGAIEALCECNQQEVAVQPGPKVIIRRPMPRCSDLSCMISCLGRSHWHLNGKMVGGKRSNLIFLD